MSMTSPPAAKPANAGECSAFKLVTPDFVGCESTSTRSFERIAKLAALLRLRHAIRRGAGAVSGRTRRGTWTRGRERAGVPRACAARTALDARPQSDVRPPPCWL